MHWGECREEGDPHGFTHDINWLLRVVLFPDELPGLETMVTMQAAARAEVRNRAEVQNGAEALSPVALRRQRERFRYAVIK